MVLHGETLVFVTTAIVATVAVVESGSTFRETCLATDVQNVSRNQPCYTVQRLLKHISQRRCTQVSAKSFNVTLFRNKNTESDDLKRYVRRFEATRIMKICLK